MYSDIKVIFLICDAFWSMSPLKSGTVLFVKASVSLVECLTDSSYYSLNE